MPGGYNLYYRELKDEMKAHSIRYSDIAKVTGQTLATIQQWLKSPVLSSRWKVVAQAIEQIKSDRENGKGWKYSPLPKSAPNNRRLRFNTDLRLKLKEQHITQNDLAAELDCERQQITYWLGMPLHPERREQIERAINAIMERRENHPITAENRMEPSHKTDRQDRKKSELPHPKEGQPRTVKLLIGTQILPWKGANVNDKRGIGGKDQERGKG